MYFGALRTVFELLLFLATPQSRRSSSPATRPTAGNCSHTKNKSGKQLSLTVQGSQTSIGENARKNSSGDTCSQLAAPEALAPSIGIRTARIQATVGKRNDEDTRHCEMVEKEIAARFGVMTDGMKKLSNVFSGAAEILAARVLAITTISRCDFHEISASTHSFLRDHHCR